MSNKEKILERLDSMGVPHETWHHEAAHTMEDCLALPFAKPEVTICKNILLCNRQKTEFWLYVTLPDKPFRTAEVSKLLGVSRLSFAPEECLEQMLQVHSGSLAPFGLWFDEQRQIRFVVDRDIRKTSRIAFHPCDNTATVVFDQKDFWERIVPTFGQEPILLTTTGQPPVVEAGK